MTSILSQPTLAARGALVARLRQAAQHMETQRAAYQEAVEAYNAVLREVEAFRDSIIAVLQEEIDRHPEAWLESRRGQASLALQEAWEELDTSPVEPPDGPETSHADELAGAPTEL
jgi:hypothetical protein